MAQPLKKSVGTGGPAYCKRRNCPGVCPAKVVAQKFGTGKRARCRVCEQEFTLPPGAAEMFPAYNNKKQGTPESNQVKMLKQHNAHLKTLLEKNKEAIPDPKAKVGEVESNPQSVTGLQSAYDLMQKSGASKELLASLEKELKAAKEAAKPKFGGDPCKAILGKLTAAKKRKQQLEEQFKKDLDKVSATKLKLVEVTKEVLVTEKQKTALFKEHGHNDGKIEPLFAPPPDGCTPFQAMQWKAFCETQQNAMHKFFGEVFQAVAEETKPEDGKKFNSETWEGDPYSASYMGVEKDVEQQGRAKILKGVNAQPVVTADKAESSVEAAGNVGHTVDDDKGGKPKRAWATMDGGEQAIEPASASSASASTSKDMRGSAETMAVVDGGRIDDDADDEDLQEEAAAAVEAFEAHIQNESHNNEKALASGDGDDI